MQKFYKIIVFPLFLIVPMISVAQNPCSDRLKLAKQLFESGQIEEIPKILDSCLNEGFTKTQENQAYKLLIQTYLFDYNRDKAKEVMMRYLTKYPENKFTYNDPIEIKEIFDLFKVKPNWGLGFYAGINVSNVYSNEIYSVFETNNIGSTYQQKYGFSAGFFFEKYLGNHAALSLGINYKKLSYLNKETTSNNLAFVTFKENVSFLSAPFTFSVHAGNGKLAPFLYIGSEFNYLLRTTGDFRFEIVQNNQDILSEAGNMNMEASRNRIGIAALGGLGFRYKIPRGLFKIWIGYNYSVTNYVNNKNRYQNTDVFFKYRHIDDNIKPDQISVGFTYSRILYKIKPK